MSGPIEGLRVIDLCDDSGRFATKMLAEFGADVVRITTRGSAGQSMADPQAAALGGVLDWWYDGGKRRHLLDLTTAAGQNAYRQLAASADLIVETTTPGTLADLGIDHEHLLAHNLRLVQVSITPFGRTGPRAGWAGSDLVASALGGFMSVTGLPDRPLAVWGRQAHVYAAFMGVICGLAGVRAARADGRGRHADVSIHETIAGSIENPLMQWCFDDVLQILPKVAPRQGALHWLRAYDLTEARTGHVMITPTPSRDNLVEWMIEAGWEEAKAWGDEDAEAALTGMDDFMGSVKRWVKSHDAMDIWWEAQMRHVAFGGVHDIAEVAAIPQFEHRGFFQHTDWEGPEVPQPARQVVFSQTPVGPPRPPAAADAQLAEILATWGQTAGNAGGAALDRPLSGIRVADFTWVLAGPFCTRMLGDLGADVIKIQNEEHATMVNHPGFPYYFVWNRSKRSVTMNMRHPDALAAVRKLLEQCDVLVENYSAGVLSSWGLDYETVHAWNPRLVYVTMSGCGHDGPWQKVISYAPTIHALCGITKLTNFPERGDVGAGFSLNDHLAGFSAATTALAALHGRERTGLGQKVDMAQLETGTYCIGPALLDYLANGRTAEPRGNADGLEDHVPNEVYPCQGDSFLAVTVTDPGQWRALVDVVGDVDLADPALLDVTARRQHRAVIDAAVGKWAAARSADEAMEALQAAGVPAGKVQHAGDLVEQDPQLAARGFWQSVQHEVFGERVADSFPALWDGRRLALERLSPAYLGEHNLDVWGEIAGLTPEAVAEAMASELFA